MNGWMVLGCVVLILVALLWIPLRAQGQSKPKQAPVSTPKEEKPAPKPGLSLGSWNTFRGYLPLICEAAGELRRKVVIRRLNIHLVWAGENPASAAIGYGMIHGVIGGLWNLIDHSFRVKDHKFVVDLDYEKKEPQVQLQTVLSLTLGQIISFGIRYGMKFIAMQRKERKKTDNSQEVNSHE